MLACHGRFSLSHSNEITDMAASPALSFKFAPDVEEHIAHRITNCAGQVPNYAHINPITGRDIAGPGEDADIVLGGEVPSGVGDLHECLGCRHSFNRARMTIGLPALGDDRGFILPNLLSVARGDARLGDRPVTYYSIRTEEDRYFYMPDEPPVVVINRKMELLGEFYTPHVLTGVLAREFQQDALGEDFDKSGEVAGRAVFVLAVRRFVLSVTGNGQKRKWGFSHHPNIQSPPCGGGARLDWAKALEGDPFERAVIAHTFTTGTNYDNPLRRDYNQVVSYPISRLIWADRKMAKNSAFEWRVVEVNAMGRWSDWAAYFHCRGAATKEMKGDGNSPDAGTYWTRGHGTFSRGRPSATALESLQMHNAAEWGCAQCPMRCPMKTVIGLPDRGSMVPVADSGSHASVAAHLHLSYRAMGAPLDEGQMLRWYVSALCCGAVYNIPMAVHATLARFKDFDSHMSPDEIEWLYHTAISGVTTWHGALHTLQTRPLWPYGANPTFVRATLLAEKWWDAAYEEINSGIVEAKDVKKEA